MDAKGNVRSKCSEKISRISVAISATSLTLVTLLFMRIKFVYNNSKALETRLENRIQRIDDDLKTNIERIVKKRLQIYETASTTRRKERRDIIFNKSLLIRTSVLLAFFNNQHYSASQHKMIFSSVFLLILQTEYSLCSTAVDCEIRQNEIYLKLYFICMLPFYQRYFGKGQTQLTLKFSVIFSFSQALCERKRLR